MLDEPVMGVPMPERAKEKLEKLHMGVRNVKEKTERGNTGDGKGVFGSVQPAVLQQDFLGKMYMSLNLGNHWKGQFFTPYDICTLMSEITVGSEAVAEAKTRDYISVNDPACGAGATLIAAANTFKRHRINYQQKVLFVGQDIDRVVAQMCYI